MNPSDPGPAAPALAERVRQALLTAALEAHEDAGLAGLCAEGRWEAVVGALRGLDLGPLLDPPASATEGLAGTWDPAP